MNDDNSLSSGESLTELTDQELQLVNGGGDRQINWDAAAAFTSVVLTAINPFLGGVYAGSYSAGRFFMSIPSDIPQGNDVTDPMSGVIVGHGSDHGS